MSDESDARLAAAVRAVFVELGLIPRASDPDELVSLEQAAEIACTKARTLRTAINSRELAAFGGERDRSIRRRDLEAWIESRKLPPLQTADDEDLDRRIARKRRSAA